MALYTVKLDETLHEELVFARPDVDVDDVKRFGRQQHVVGATYTTDADHVHFFDTKLEQVMDTLRKAVSQPLLGISEASLDESTLLLWGASDSDPGVSYIFDRASRHLNTFLVARGPLEGVKLATVRSVNYPAADGTSIPAYLTLPPGQESARGLPAIVMPHGGPFARDSWGFDYVAQFFANRGYAVLQPNFRGSSGYGDAWSIKGGFRSWSVAIGDVLAAGRWLVSQGNADPGKLAIVGWSYGGYAALQSAVVDPELFKAVIAIAPVTDLAYLKEEQRGFTNFQAVSDFVGSGASMHEGSPIEHAERIKAPVLLFHGGMDFNVSVEESRRMAARLKSAGKDCELVTWDKLDHQLDDSDARTELLRRSDAFLRRALGLQGGG
jgi:dipeptidyl aminopeptidase/acylaminoacyl peptidase